MGGSPLVCTLQIEQHQAVCEKNPLDSQHDDTSGWFLLPAETTQIEQHQAAQQDMMRQLLHGMPTISPYLVLKVGTRKLKLVPHIQPGGAQVGRPNSTHIRVQQQ